MIIYHSLRIKIPLVFICREIQQRHPWLNFVLALSVCDSVWCGLRTLDRIFESRGVTRGSIALISVYSTCRVLRRRLSLSMKFCAQRKAGRSLRLRHQSLAFCARLYAKPCEKRSAWGDGCYSTAQWFELTKCFIIFSMFPFSFLLNV